MSEDRRVPIQKGMRPEGKAMRPEAMKKPPTAPPPKPSDSGAAKPPRP